ncbi:MAG: coproporphyrinogen III oxidase [Actinobacteria bacterium ADurb.Bin444]|nr:MAG: coproporphyrinogen III oxidase [Actinobacteria bacterium ADurb.Bin444]
MTTHPGTEYRGLEQGPIRPPSEAASLLLRVTRNCPWNKCSFCPVYKGTRFSRRPVEHVLADIDAVARYLYADMGRKEESEALAAERQRKFPDLPSDDALAASVAWNWRQTGMKSVFLQDANSLVIRPGDMIRILERIRERFPWVERVTTYARSHTLATHLTDADLAAMAAAGLNRIHVGFESGSDKVLALVDKGATKAMHIEAGLRVKHSAIELSAYYMPGLGGEELWEDNARETADVMNQVNPDFIRLRSLAVPDHVPMAAGLAAGTFRRPTDELMAREILLFVESLEGITSVVKSDHILNLFQDLEGRLPEDKERMASIPRAFLEMDQERRLIYQVGRRWGIFEGVADMWNPQRLSYAERLVQRLGATPENIDAIVDEQVKRFI